MTDVETRIELWLMDLKTWVVDQVRQSHARVDEAFVRQDQALSDRVRIALEELVRAADEHDRRLDLVAFPLAAGGEVQVRLGSVAAVIGNDGDPAEIQVGQVRYRVAMTRDEVVRELRGEERLEQIREG